MKGAPRRGRRALSQAEGTGLAAFGLAFLLALVEPTWATVPLTLFVLLCAVAPFFPTLPFFLPVVSRGSADRKTVALTFDDGPDPATTPLLLDLLARHGMRATFFVTGRNALRHPALIQAILDQGHTIGNHSCRHDNFIMLKSVRRLRKEILTTQTILKQFDITPLAFRPPVGITNPRLAAAIQGTPLFVVNFNRRAGDWGNRRLTHLSRRIIRRLHPGDIILLHDTRPADPRRFAQWRREINRLPAGIAGRGLTVVPLAQLIQRPVMVKRRAGRGS